MNREEVKGRVLAEHAQLRDLVSALDAAALLARREGRIDLVREAARAMATTFMRHIEHEEAVLAPVLSDGAQVRRLLLEHEAQRAAAERLLELSREGAAGELVHAARFFCAALLDDMAYEEEHLLRQAPSAEARR